MTMKARVTLVAMVVLAAMWSTGCGHYVCGIVKGNTTCSSGGGTTKSGGGVGATGDAYVFTASPGAIQSFTLTEAQGTLAVNCTPSTCPEGLPNLPVGTEEWAAVAQKNVLYVGYSPSSIYAWTIASDGSLTNGGSSVYPFTLPFAVAGVGQQAMIVNPAGTLLFVIDPTAGNAQIDVYQIGNSGGLTQVGVPAALPSGFQPYNLAIDGLGKYLYVSNNSGSATTTQIMAYTIGSGVLNTVPGSPFSLGLTQMQGDPSGQFMIGTKATLNDLDPNIYVLGITQSGANAGAITALGSAATANPPNSVTVQPGANGTLVYAFSLIGTSIGGPVEGYTLTTSTGALTIMGGSPFLNVGGDAGQFDQVGKFLFVRDLFSKNMTAFDVTASPTLSTSVGSQGWDQNPWAWVVTDSN